MAVLRELRERVVELCSERRARVGVVMEMDFDFAEAALRELAQPIEKIRAIFFAGKKPAVARRAAERVAILAELRVVIRPRNDARATDLVRRLAPQRLAG